MRKNHNKKRNVGIIYELLLRSITDSLISDNRDMAQRALNIIEERFDKSTELYKEFRLFNALARSTVSGTTVAAGVLTEAKQAARRSDSRRLDIEKSNLIKEINHTLADKDFYSRKIPNYKTYATIQTLLNDWRSGDSSNLKRMVEYETRVVDWLLLEKSEAESVLAEDHSNHQVDSLVVKLMTEKLNNKYDKNLTVGQKSLIRDYALSIHNDSGDSIRESLKKIRDEVLDQLQGFKKKTGNKILLEKIDYVFEKIQAQNFESVNDSSISRFLVLSNLHDEIKDAIDNE